MRYALCAAIAAFFCASVAANDADNQMWLNEAEHHCDAYGYGTIKERACRSEMAKQYRAECYRYGGEFERATGTRREQLQPYKEAACYRYDRFEVFH